MARAVSRYPDRFVGYCYVNPCHTEGALADFRRGIEERALRGLKLWMACHCDDPLVFPIVEQAVAYGLPILVHAWSKAGGSLPTESEADHVAALASRFPEARIVMAHMSGDWLVKLRLYVTNRLAVIRQAYTQRSDPATIQVPDPRFRGPVATSAFYSAYVRC